MVISLKAAREPTGLSQEELAERIGSGRSTIAKIENGTRQMTAEMASRIAPVLGCEVEDLYLDNPVNVVGYVGAGARVMAYDDYAHGDGMDQIERPAFVKGRAVAVEVRGDSMIPVAEDGWRIVYTEEQTLDESKVLNRLCVVKCSDDGVLVKRVMRGSKPGHYHLASSNAPMIEDAELMWAAPVKAIVPR